MGWLEDLFQNPKLGYSPNLEPPGWNVLREQMMRKIFDLQGNPYGYDPSQGRSMESLLPSGGRGTFDPVTGSYSGGGSSGGMGGGPRNLGPRPTAGMGGGGMPAAPDRSGDQRFQELMKMISQRGGGGGSFGRPPATGRGQGPGSGRQPRMIGRDGMAPYHDQHGSLMGYDARDTRTTSRGSGGRGNTGGPTQGGTTTRPGAAAPAPAPPPTFGGYGPAGPSVGPSMAQLNAMAIANGGRPPTMEQLQTLMPQMAGLGIQGTANPGQGMTFTGPGGSSYSSTGSSHEGAGAGGQSEFLYGALGLPPMGEASGAGIHFDPQRYRQVRGLDYLMSRLSQNQRRPPTPQQPTVSPSTPVPQQPQQPQAPLPPTPTWGTNTTAPTQPTVSPSTPAPPTMGPSTTAPPPGPKGAPPIWQGEPPVSNPGWSTWGATDGQVIGYDSKLERPHGNRELPMTGPTRGRGLPGGGAPPPGGMPGQPPGGGSQLGQPAPTSNPANFGQPMHPWLMPYEGNFTAPMSPWETGALNEYSDFVGGGQGMDIGRGYLNDVLGGKYLDIKSNPWLEQIQSGMQGTKDYQDTQALKRIQSQMAAGGMGLSGASLGAQSDFLGQSNNNFQTLMGNLMNQNYGRERGSMDMAPRELGNMASQMGQGYGQLMNMGSVPRDIQQRDYGAQYADWLRQTGGMRDDFRYPDTLSQQLLYGGGFRGQTPNQYGSSTGDMLAGLAGNSDIDWGGLINGVGGLFSGGGGGTGETAQYPGETSMMDGRVMGYDGGPGCGPDGRRMGYDAAGPKGYWDSDYYNKALTAANAKFTAEQAAAIKGKNTMLPAILAMIMQMMGGKKKKSGASNQIKPSAGAAPAKPGDPKAGKVGQPNKMYPNDTLPGNPFSGLEYNTNTGQWENTVYGTQLPEWADVNANPDFYATDPSLPAIPFSNMDESGPQNPWDIFPSDGGGGMPQDWYGGDLDMGNVPTDYGSFEDAFGGDYGGGGSEDIGFNEWS